MRVVFDLISEIDGGAFIVRLAETDRDRLARSGSATSTHTVVIANGAVERRHEEIIIEWSQLTALVLGCSEIAIVLLGKPSKTSDAHDVGDKPEGGTDLDGQLSKLPRHIAEAARRLLEAVYCARTDRLAREERRFVSRPDNFWTLVVQPRDQSLRITVRGRPATFGVLEKIKLVDDRPGYSSFKISTVDQIDEAIQTILSASRKR